MALLLHGDCLALMKTLPSRSIDCFVCDLPYGCLTGGAGKEKAKRREIKRYVDGEEQDGVVAVYNGGVIAGCAWDIKIDLSLFWEQVKRLARDDHTPVLMFCTTKFGVELINSNPDWFRYDIVWDKGCGVSFLSANKMPMRSHEMIYVFSKKGAYYKRVDIEGDFPACGGGKLKSNVYGKGKGNLERIQHTNTAGRRCPLSVIEFSNKKGKGNHPTQKPAELYKWLLERYCVAGGTMLDPTAGSFSSVFTARDMGLHAIGIEKDDTFFWKAVAKI